MTRPQLVAESGGLLRTVARLGAAVLGFFAARHALAADVAQAILVGGLGLALLWFSRWPVPLPDTPLRRAAPVALFLLWSAVFIALSSVVVDGRRYFSLFDDAMVSMRYGWNLAHGDGLVWNPGQPPVEGYSNLLMTLAMAAASLLDDRSAAVLVIQVLGVVTALAAGYLARALAATIAPSAPPGWVLFGVLAYYPLAFWSLLGMETGLLAVLILLATIVVVRHGHDRRPLASLPLLIGLMTLTRTDAVVPAAVLLAYRALRYRRAGGRGWVPLVEVTAAMLLPLGQLFFRWRYYADLLPNTYYLKIAGWPLAERLAAGAGYVALFAKAVLPALLLAVLSLAHAPSAGRWLAAALVASSLVYQVWSGGDAWPLWRHACPVLPLLAILAVDGAVWLAATVSTGRFERRLAAVMLLTAFTVADRAFLRQALFVDLPAMASDNEQGIRSAVLLRRICSPPARVGVFAAGVLPYYSNLVGVDFLGKSDRHIARLPPDLEMRANGLPTGSGHNKYDLRYSIEELRPDYVAYPRWGRQDVTAFVEANYVRHRGLWLRRDSPYVRWEALSGR